MLVPVQLLDSDTDLGLYLRSKSNFPQMAWNWIFCNVFIIYFSTHRWMGAYEWKKGPLTTPGFSSCSPPKHVSTGAQCPSPQCHKHGSAEYEPDQPVSGMVNLLWSSGKQEFLFYLCFKLYIYDCVVIFCRRLYLQNYQSYETGMPMMNSSMPQHLSVLENDYHIPTSNQSYQPQLASPSHQPITSPLHHMSPEQSRLQNYSYNQTQQQVLITWL